MLAVALLPLTHGFLGCHQLTRSRMIWSSTGRFFFFFFWLGLEKSHISAQIPCIIADCKRVGEILSICIPRKRRCFVGNTWQHTLFCIILYCLFRNLSPSLCGFHNCLHSVYAGIKCYLDLPFYL